MSKFSQYGIQAERLFVEEGKGPEEISAALRTIFGAGAPSANSVYKWRDRYNWEAKRRAFRSGPQGAVASLESALPKMAATLEDLIHKAEPSNNFVQEAARVIDGISKLTKSITSIKKEMDPLGAVVFTMGKFAAFILEREKDETVKERLISHIQGFSNKIASEE